MTNTIVLTPFPRRKFIPDPITLPKPQRLRYLVETRVKLKKHYQGTYSKVVDIIDTVKTDSEISLGELTPQQKENLLDQLLESRSEVAKFYSQALLVFENMANEVAPGTFPRDDVPTTSGDFWDWVDDALEWLADLFSELADVFDHFGWDDGADGFDWVSDRINDARKWIDENRPGDDD